MSSLIRGHYWVTREMGLLMGYTTFDKKKKKKNLVAGICMVHACARMSVNSISVVPDRCNGAYERFCAMNRHLGSIIISQTCGPMIRSHTGDPEATNATENNILYCNQ